jgi:hypothetical protein
MSRSNNRWIVTISDTTRTTVALEQLSKQVSTEKNKSNNRGAVFSVRPVPRGYKKVEEDRFSQLSFETPVTGYKSLEAEELSGELRETLEMTVE